MVTLSFKSLFFGSFEEKMGGLIVFFSLIGGTWNLWGGNVLNEDANEFWDGSDYARGTFTPTNRILPRRLMVKLGLNF